MSNIRGECGHGPADGTSEDDEQTHQDGVLASPRTSLIVEGCQHLSVCQIVHGRYLPHAHNHGKEVYRRTELYDNLEVLIYFWDSRDGQDMAGWWFAPCLGGDKVWAFCPGSNSAVPPATGWRVPHDGPIDPGLTVRLHLGKRGRSKEGRQKRSGAPKQEDLRKKGLCIELESEKMDQADVRETVPAPQRQSTRVDETDSFMTLLTRNREERKKAEEQRRAEKKAKGMETRRKRRKGAEESQEPALWVGERRDQLPMTGELSRGPGEAEMETAPLAEDEEDEGLVQLQGQLEELQRDEEEHHRLLEELRARREARHWRRQALQQELERLGKGGHDRSVQPGSPASTLASSRTHDGQRPPSTSPPPPASPLPSDAHSRVQQGQGNGGLPLTTGLSTSAGTPEMETWGPLRSESEAQAVVPASCAGDPTSGGAPFEEPTGDARSPLSMEGAAGSRKAPCNGNSSSKSTFSAVAVASAALSCGETVRQREEERRLRKQARDGRKAEEVQERTTRRTRGIGRAQVDREDPNESNLASCRKLNMDLDFVKGGVTAGQVQGNVREVVRLETQSRCRSRRKPEDRGKGHVHEGSRRGHEEGVCQDQGAQGGESGTKTGEHREALVARGRRLPRSPGGSPSRSRGHKPSPRQRPRYRKGRGAPQPVEVEAPPEARPRPTSPTPTRRSPRAQDRPSQSLQKNAPVEVEIALPRRQVLEEDSMRKRTEEQDRPEDQVSRPTQAVAQTTVSSPVTASSRTREVSTEEPGQELVQKQREEAWQLRKREEAESRQTKEEAMRRLEEKMEGKRAKRRQQEEAIRRVEDGLAASGLPCQEEDSATQVPTHAVAGGGQGDLPNLSVKKEGEGAPVALSSLSLRAPQEAGEEKAVLAVQSAIDDLSNSNFETFEELRGHFHQVLQGNLDSCGAQQPALKERAASVLAQTTSHYNQIIEQRNKFELMQAQQLLMKSLAQAPLHQAPWKLDHENCVKRQASWVPPVALHVTNNIPIYIAPPLRQLIMPQPPNHGVPHQDLAVRFLGDFNGVITEVEATARTTQDLTRRFKMSQPSEFAAIAQQVEVSVADSTFKLQRSREVLQARQPEMEIGKTPQQLAMLRQELAWMVRRAEEAGQVLRASLATVRMAKAAHC